MLAERGHAMEWLLDLDVKSFWALSKSSERVNAANTIQQTLGLRVASQGTAKVLKDWLKPFREKVEVAGDSARDFLSKFGEGF
jgi:hypothetical protein